MNETVGFCSGEGEGLSIGLKTVRHIFYSLQSCVPESQLHLDGDDKTKLSKSRLAIHKLPGHRGENR